MNRRSVPTWLLVAGLAALAAPLLRADVKTTQKSLMKMEGMIGAMMTRLAGGADGTTSTEAVKGNRMIRMGESTGEIIDLTEEKVYRIDIKKKEYRVLTFAEMKAEMEKARAEAQKQMAQMQPVKPEDKKKAEDAAKQMEFSVDVKETGQHKQILNYNTREVVMIITMHEKGKTVEESGGMMMTNDMWIAPKIAALDELMDFNMRYFQRVYGGMFTGTDQAQMASMSAMMPGFGQMSEKMATEGRKLQGTTLATATTMDAVKSAAEMKAIADQSQQQPQQQQQQNSGGGLGGMLGRRLAGGRGAAGGPTQQRTTMMTMTHEYLTIANSVTVDDLAIPRGFKEKK